MRRSPRQRPLLLAARQLAGPTVGQVRESEFLKHGPRAVAAMLEPLKLQHEFDVSSAVNTGTRLNAWNTNPIDRRRRSARSRRESVAIC